MKIAIIGAGFTGLTAGLRLAKKGHHVTIFEKNPVPGGLAAGFKCPNWSWTLDEHYHHCFTSDEAILDLANEVNHPIITKRPETTVYVNDKFYKLDSPLDVLKFPELTFPQRLRMGIFIAILRYNPFWKPLERYKASEVLPKLMGRKAYETLWEPLIIKKFGPFSSDISLAWFWARIFKRTPFLAYPEKGFAPFCDSIVSSIKIKGGKIIFNSEVKKIESSKNGKVIVNNFLFDKSIVTLPTDQFIKIAGKLPKKYKENLTKLKGLSVVNLILRLKKPFFKDLSTYWLNICDKKYPLTGIVEHTNFMDKRNYNNEYLVYLLNYVPKNHPFTKMDNQELIKEYNPLLNKINDNYKSSLISTHKFIAEFAQPIFYVNYSKMIPPFKTPLNNVYLANLQQVYPWDRGTNYAVKLGNKISDIVLDD